MTPLALRRDSGHGSRSDSPTYVLELRDRSNRERIENARPEQEIEVLVRPRRDPSATPMVAKGRLSKDGTSFSVEVIQADGTQQSHRVNFESLKETIADETFKDVISEFAKLI